MRFSSFFGLVVLAIYAFLVAGNVLAAELPYEEQFNTDVFQSGEWFREDGSTTVDLQNGVLRIGSDGGYDDYAEKYVDFSLPITVETRMRLVSGGRNYTLPQLRIYFGPTVNDANYITYLPNDQFGWSFMGWHLLNESTNIHVNAPESENLWWTVKAIIREDGGELYAKSDAETDFTFVTSRIWSRPSQITRIGFKQPWDAVCEFDYIRVEGVGQEDLLPWCDNFENPTWTTNWHGSGNVSGIFVDNSSSFTGSSSLSMFGLIGSCWAAVATHPIEMNLPMEITFAMRNGSESIFGCHAFRAAFGLRSGGPDWFNCPCPQLLRVLPNGEIELPLSTNNPSVFSGYTLNTWQNMRCRLETPGDGLLHVQFWVNDAFLSEFTLPEEAWMSQSAFVDISSQEGTTWFDDVCVTALCEPAVVGSIVGQVSASCAGTEGLQLAIPIDVFDSFGNLVASTHTLPDGSFEIDNLPSETSYNVVIVPPLGFSANFDEKVANVICGQITTVDFTLSCVEITANPRTIGFWKHQLGVALGGKGTAQIGAATLCHYLDLIEGHFNSNIVNQVIIYVPPASGLCADKLQIAGNLLNLKGSASMTARAKQQLMALLLNVAAGFISQTAVISADGARVTQAITYCDNLIDDPNGNHEKAKTICDDINNGIQVPAGMIPLSTANIAYRNVIKPDEFALLQNYPNPFNPSTEISFHIPSATHVKLELFNINGQKVAMLVDGDFESGFHSITFDGSEFASGIYLYRMTASEFVETKKMLLIK